MPDVSMGSPTLDWGGGAKENRVQQVSSHNENGHGQFHGGVGSEHALTVGTPGPSPWASGLP